MNKSIPSSEIGKNTVQFTVIAYLCKIYLAIFYYEFTIFTPAFHVPVAKVNGKCFIAVPSGNRITIRMSIVLTDIGVQQYKLRFRRAAHARAHLPLRETTEQDRHPEAGHRVHRLVEGGAHGRL